VKRHAQHTDGEVLKELLEGGDIHWFRPVNDLLLEELLLYGTNEHKPSDNFSSYGKDSTHSKTRSQ
jgi:hypothetical protein